jgi:uncharacterized protein (DUF736 family)
MPNENKIGALWLKEKNGKKYFSGQVEINGEKHNIVVFKNTYKQEEKHPDYNVLLSQGGQQNSQQQSESFEDDVPF